MDAAWSPLRHKPFRSLWLAQFVSNVGGFMQVVGAVWLMGTLAGTPALVALVQTAMSTPVFFFSLPAGALADIVDRRRLILGMQVLMLSIALTLALLTHFGAVTPLLLLALTFALFSANALNQPAWQSLQPELVPREDFPQAVTLGAASQNLARIVGPAIGGVILAFSGPEIIFTLNALSYVGVIVVLARRRTAPRADAAARERLVPALRSGIRYARYASSLRATLLRTVALTIPASATMALLPVVARDDLALDSRGYGVLLACYGVGAVSMSFVLPAIRSRIGTDGTVLLGIVAIALNLVSLATVRSPVVLGATLIIGGAGWISALSTLMVATQTALPKWVRARGIGFQFLAFQGGVGLGSALHGVVADRVGLAAAFAGATVLLAIGWLATRHFSLGRIERLDLGPAVGLSDIPGPVEPLPEHSPVVITVEYRVDAAGRQTFVETMRRVERMRNRVGANRWELAQDPADEARYLETFRADSWTEYRRGRSRMTVADQKIEEAVAPYRIAQGITASA
jgi:predicted MFS family arabinose efflux permease